MTFLLASGPGLRGNREERGNLRFLNTLEGLPYSPTLFPGLNMADFQGSTWSQSVWLCFPFKGLHI